MIRVTFDTNAPEEQGPAPSWQELLPGFGPGAVSLAKQPTLWDLGQPERKPAKPEAPDQGETLF